MTRKRVRTSVLNVLSKPIVLIHGYSAEGEERPVSDIYGTLPEDLSELFGESNVVKINLSRWISLSDGIALDDVSFAFQRALQSDEHKALLNSGFHVVVHSTGALVIRNWIRLFDSKPSHVENLIHLAGANFGSGLAHIGQGQLARWARLIFQGTGSGVRVLDELELGAGKTLDLHLYFLGLKQRMHEDYHVQEYCLNGSRTTDASRAIPIRYVKEDSSDGVVRTSGCNLNFNHVRVTPRRSAFTLPAEAIEEEVIRRLDNDRALKQWYTFDTSRRAGTANRIPFALLYETTHTGDKYGIVSGQSNRVQVLTLITEALTTPLDGDDYARVIANWDRASQRTRVKASKLKPSWAMWDKQAQYEGHSQLIFRIRDQFGCEVVHHDITFKPSDESKWRAAPKLEHFIEDVHVNRHNPGTVTYYLRTQKFDKEADTWINLIDQVAPLTIEISGTEPDSHQIRYLPLSRLLKQAELRVLIQPLRTTLIDITLLRLPTHDVFALEPVEAGN
jgi:hypothetical protein